MGDELSDDEFLTYCDTHSMTERALFHSAHIARCLRLAGHNVAADAWNAKDTFKSCDLRDLVEEVRNHTRAAQEPQA